MKPIVLLIPLLLVSLSGCSEENNIPSGYQLTIWSFYSDTLWFTSTAGYTVNGETHEYGQLSSEANPNHVPPSGASIGCLDDNLRPFPPFYLRITIWNNGKYDSTSRVLQVGNWTGIICGESYTFVIDAQGQPHLYEGRQDESPPFRDELTRVPPYA